MLNNISMLQSAAKSAMIIAVVLAWCATADAQIYRVAEMNADQIRALDKQRTVVILTGGILEQHGPHLPSFADGYANEWMSQRLAEALVERPGTKVLMFPTIPLGHEGANEIGATHVYPGTYSVRRSTLRAIFMDLAMELGEQGFRYIFVMHGHGAPYHNQMLDHAGEFFRDIYGGRMVNLHGLVPTAEQSNSLRVVEPDLGLSKRQKNEIGNMDEHAGFEETSRLLFLRPDLVSPTYDHLKPLPTNSPEEFFRVARNPAWPGYLSSPRLARTSYGAKLQISRATRHITIATSILDGVLDERNVPRYAAMMTGNKQMMMELSASTQNEEKRERMQRDWMRSKGID